MTTSSAVQLAGAPSAAPTPRPGVRIRRIDLRQAASVSSLAITHLCPEERWRAERGTAAVRRRRVLLRAGLRQCLGTLLDVAPARVPLVEVQGRPVLALGDGRLHVSCSASGQVGLVALSVDGAVGVDVEQVGAEDLRSASAEGWLCPAEERALTTMFPASHRWALSRCWTQKEAVLKGLGLGLPGGPGTVATPVADGGRIGDWRVLPVAVAPGHVASAALRTVRDDVDVLVDDLVVGNGQWTGPTP